MSECPCLESTWPGEEYSLTFIGVDEACGRFAEVEVGHCRRCGRYWLHYRWEIEAFSHSGRWCRGLISSEQAHAMTADAAEWLLMQMDWYWVGGSYYDGKSYRSSGPLD